LVATRAVLALAARAVLALAIAVLALAFAAIIGLFGHFASFHSLGPE